VVDPTDEINELLMLTDVLSRLLAIFEFALLRRPIVVMAGDLAEYARDPGVCLDFSSEMIGIQVTDTDGVADAILGGRFDLTAYDAFIARHAGACDGHASARFVERPRSDPAIPPAPPRAVGKLEAMSRPRTRSRTSAR
jgi:CDP-glycerol glycerophosphotransferase (TagB/SpsB family)